MNQLASFILFLVCTIATGNVHAKIWRVNNNTGVARDFAQPGNAVASASVLNGDTIHIEPSLTNYSGFSSNKRLVWIGPGYFLASGIAFEPANTGLQATALPANIDNITLAAGAEGSRFMGIYFGNFNIGASTGNIWIEKCRFSGGVIMSNAGVVYSNITIRKCFFNHNCSINAVAASPGSVSGLVIENNIFNGDIFANLSSAEFGSGGNIFRNNTCGWFRGGILYGFYVANNIFTFLNDMGNLFAVSVVKNNIFASAVQTLPGTAVGNQLGIHFNSVFIDDFVNAVGSIDHRFMLRAGSPAIGTGVTISGYTPDCGAFGGPDPYRLSGIPAVPTIYSLTVPTSIPQGQATMSVQLSTRNNN
ncbi:hypothetical protein [Pseudobacter ginsenosidimutans]|uniref:Parallel beta helix pectate lyase-like protein n=1 Tax=Pseudobacter ginsenosidimutans TaxID=661488 RepID=A0A4Q7N5N3_9BACT|nr:hypothetical protein [Pseudobacter ginsenosidimutans]QEC44871.1 hypothetical protein FSB84_25510 [Pseudobacter ginsenosidimutans]RZS76362.1 hypothetical protein EV199_2245 [Pseudobacter ginsenosidimutans]